LNSALLLGFENGCKVPLVVGVTENCISLATTSLISTLSKVTSIVEPFITGTQSLDFNLLPPFVLFSVYKTAAVVTERLLMDNDSTEGMKRLRILRHFLQIVGKRWLSCGKLMKKFEK
jgi:hypothetical protein